MQGTIGGYTFAITQTSDIIQALPMFSFPSSHRNLLPFFPIIASQSPSFHTTRSRVEFQSRAEVVLEESRWYMARAEMRPGSNYSYLGQCSPVNRTVEGFAVSIPTLLLNARAYALEVAWHPVSDIIFVLWCSFEVLTVSRPTD
jgi:hypothetical protein